MRKQYGDGYLVKENYLNMKKPLNDFRNSFSSCCLNKRRISYDSKIEKVNKHQQ